MIFYLLRSHQLVRKLIHDCDFVQYLCTISKLLIWGCLTDVSILAWFKFQTDLWPPFQNKSLGWVDAKPFDLRIAKPLFMYCTIALTNFGPSYSVRTPFSASGTGLDWSKTVFLKRHLLLLLSAAAMKDDFLKAL